MKTYIEKKFFNKYWGWFTPPKDVVGVDIANFFSYERCDIEGFNRSESLTSIIDLSRSIEEIWEGMRISFIRKQIEQGKRRGIIVEKGGNFKSFYKLYREFSLHIGFGRVAAKSLQEQGILFTSSYDDKLLAGGVFIGDGQSLRAWVLASTRFENEGRMRDIIGESSRMILWEALCWAKENNYRTFDMGGIAPDSDSLGIRHVSEFKESFGGTRTMSYYYYKIYSPILNLWMRVRHHLFR